MSLDIRSDLIQLLDISNYSKIYFAVFSFLVSKIFFKNDRLALVTIDSSSSNKTTFCQMYFEKYLFCAVGETLFYVKRAAP